MAKSKKIARVSKECVACGACMTVCPLKAISIDTGVNANIDLEKCVGCGKCSVICPASVIELCAREVTDET